MLRMPWSGRENVASGAGLIGKRLFCCGLRVSGINICIELDMHWRSLISGLLILVLMPAWSLAASCDFYCRATTAPTNSSVLAHAPHIARPAIQHHHHPDGMVNAAAQDQVAQAASNGHQLFGSRTCCRGTGTRLSMSCVTPQQSVLQEARLAQNGNDNSEVVQSRPPAFRLIEQDRNRPSSPHDERSTVCSPSPILRI